MPIFLALFLLPATSMAAENAAAPPSMAALFSGIKQHWMQLGSQQKDVEAAKLLRQAAEHGNPEAQDYLGQIYVWGMIDKIDNAAAEKWFRMAADQGNADAQINIGVLYQYGGFNGAAGSHPSNAAEAFKWYQKAADQGDAAAQFRVGDMYAKGLGVKQDYVQAYMWFNLKPWVAKLGDLTKTMTPEQIAEAKRLAAAWKPPPTPTAAATPP